MRIAIVGHSFGGTITLLCGERDAARSGEVTFGAGANSWKQSLQLRERVLAAVEKTTVPIMLIQAANDYDTTPATEIAAELERLHKPHLLKIYPALGKSSDDGHNFLYLGIPEWGPVVFKFLEEKVKR